MQRLQERKEGRRQEKLFSGIGTGLGGERRIEAFAAYSLRSHPHSGRHLRPLLGSECGEKLVVKCADEG